MGGRSKTAVIGSKSRPKRLKILLDEILIHLDFFCVVRPFFFKTKTSKTTPPPSRKPRNICHSGDGGGKSLLFNFYIKARNQSSSKTMTYLQTTIFFSEGSPESNPDVSGPMENQADVSAILTTKYLDRFYNI